MDTHRIRNLIPPVYGVLVILGFLISTIAGVVVLIVAGALSGVLWSSLSGRRSAPSDAGTRDERLAARAERRAERR
jgi:hypothetical protein